MSPRCPNALLLTVVVGGCLTSTGVARAQTRAGDPGAVIAGRIVAGATRAGLPGVEVRIAGDAAHVTTDSSGAFVLATNVRGTATVILRKLGYGPMSVPIDVGPGDSLHIETAMDKAVTNLDTLKVVGRSESIAPPRLAGFERRREHNGGGVFITPEELEKTASTSIVDLIRTVPSIKILDASFGRLVAASSRGGRLDASGRPTPCRIRVMFDGMLMPINERPIENNKIGDGMFAPPDLEVPLPVTSPKLVHGIEIYPGPATMPRDLIPNGEDAFCGLIAIWSK